MSTDNEMVCHENESCDAAVLAPEEKRMVEHYKPQYTSEYSEDAWEVRVSLPGVVKSDVKISIENEILRVEALRKMDCPEGWKRLTGSSADRQYVLKLDVGPEVDGSNIEAHLKNGELQVRLPLRDEAKPKEIPIK